MGEGWCSEEDGVGEGWGKVEGVGDGWGRVEGAEFPKSFYIYLHTSPKTNFPSR